MKLLWIAGFPPNQSENDAIASLEGFTTEVARGVPEGLELLRNCQYDAVLVNLPASGWTPDEILEELQRINSLVPVLIRNISGSFDEAVRLTRLGAWHYLDESGQGEELRELLSAAVEHRRSREQALFGNGLSDEPWRKLLVGDGQAMRSTFQMIRLVGARRATVLITGETGTGKEMVARALHMASGRGALPMVAVNCSALPEQLLEAELFGHVRGAFTGAIATRIGRFEQAHRSTLFLDEIGDMPLETQTKLLRVLQEREFQRIGSSETIRVDVRVIAASNSDLVEQVRSGKFREDLYYRLNVVPIQVPPLRDRLEDVSLLAHHFVDKICRQEGIPPRVLPPETLDRLSSYPWPGNVRQLENAVEMAVALCGDRETLHPSDFPLPSPAQWKAPAPATLPLVAVPDAGLDFEQTVGRIERSILEQALRKTRGNKKLAADMLRLKRTTLAAKLKSLEAVAV